MPLPDPIDSVAPPATSNVPAAGTVVGDQLQRPLLDLDHAAGLVDQPDPDRRDVAGTGLADRAGVVEPEVGETRNGEIVPEAGRTRVAPDRLFQTALSRNWNAWLDGVTTVTVPALSTTRLPRRMGELAPPPMVPVPFRNSFPLPSIEPPRKTKFPFTVTSAAPSRVPLWVKFPTVSGALTVACPPWMRKLLAGTRR